MTLPLLKLIDMTGDLRLPETVVLLQVLQAEGGGRRRLGRLTLVRNDELDRNLFVFGDQTFESFENPFQFRIVVTDDGGRNLGETIIDANDINSPEEELFIKFFLDGIVGGRFTNWGTRSSRVKGWWYCMPLSCSDVSMCADRYWPVTSFSLTAC
jgi:hypothetical protein